MKTTDHFTAEIEDYLDWFAEQDELFAEKYHNPAKNLDDCVTYILNTVKASGCNGFADEEIYSMAVDYYDEPDIEIGAKVDAQVIVNHAITLTDEEKAEARERAMKRATDEAYSEMKHAKKATKKSEINNQQTLF